MPDKNVQLPDGRIVAFPDSMSDDDIGNVLKQQLGPSKSPTLAERAEKWYTTPTQMEVPGNVPGVEQAPEGVTSSPQQTLRRGAAISSAMGAPAAVVGLATAPVATIAGLGGATLGGAAGTIGGKAIGEQVGAPELGQDVGGL